MNPYLYMDSILQVDRISDLDGEAEEVRGAGVVEVGVLYLVVLEICTR